MTTASTLDIQHLLDAASRNDTAEISELVRDLPAERLTRLSLCVRTLATAVEAEVLRRAIAGP